MAKQTVQSAVKCKCGNDKEYNPQFGYLDCKDCRVKEKKLSERTYEFVPEHIKEEREEFKKQTIQPFRNGVLSKEYVDLYGTKYIDVTPEEVKNAKNVWGELEYYK